MPTTTNPPARSRHAHSGPTSHHCRCVSWSGMQSYGNRRTKSKSKCSGEQITPPQQSEAGSLTKMSAGSCIGILQKRGEHSKEDMLEGSFLQGFLLNHVSSPARRSTTFFEQDIRLCLLTFDEVSLRLVFTIADNFRPNSKSHPQIRGRSKCRFRSPRCLSL